MAMPKANPFVEAKKEQAKLRMAINGPSGSGKTWTSLLIAERLVELEGGKIAFLDTEGRSARKYADRFTFDVYDLSQDYNPQKYIDGIIASAQFGYTVIVIDSFSHAWNGAGGVLEIVDKAGKKMGGNDWAGWSKGRPAQNSLVDTLINADIHIIGTMRTKTDWVLEVDSRGKNKPVKKGLAPVQSSDFEYEFDVVIQLSMEHEMTISKSRCPQLPVNQEYPEDSAYQISEELHNWLTDGELFVRPHWSDDPSAISKIVDWAKSKEYGNNEPDLLKLLESKDWKNYEDGREACTKIQEAHEALKAQLDDKSNSQPSSEPALPTWTASDKDELASYLKKHYEKSLDQVFTEIPDTEFSHDLIVFANAGEAINKINQVATKHNWQISTNVFRVIPKGKGGIIEVDSPIGTLAIFSRKKFTEMLGQDYQDANELDIANLEPGTYEAGYMMVSWKQSGKANTITNATPYDPYDNIPI